MNSQMAHMLSALASGLGVTARFLWAAEIREAYIQGFLNLGQMVTAIIATILCAKFVMLSIREVRKANDGEVAWVLGIAFGALLAIACAVWAIVSLNTALNDLINPTNYAFQAIAGAFNPMTNNYGG